MSKFTLGVLLAVVSVIGYVVLAFAGDPDIENARGIFLFTTPFIAILLGGSAFEQIKERTDRIEKQTNGALTKRLQETADAAAETAIRRVLDEQNSKRYLGP